MEDSLSALSNVIKQELSFDLILLSAVWMHIPPSDRARSIRKRFDELQQELPKKRTNTMHVVGKTINEKLRY